jgi:peptidoglycan biosynthesis protein MviN/MurJ (putative lipid II flippase)
VFLSRLTFPYLGLISLVAMLSGLLNARSRFGPGAAAPVLLDRKHIRSGRAQAVADYLWNDHAYLRLGFSNAHWISEELVRAMRDAGCVSISYGFDR